MYSEHGGLSLYCRHAYLSPSLMFRNFFQTFSYIIRFTKKQFLQFTSFGNIFSTFYSLVQLIKYIYICYQYIDLYFLSLTLMEKTLWLRLSLAMAEMDVAETENSQLLVGGLANSQIFPD